MQSHAGTFESTCCCSLRVVIMKMFSVSLAVSVSPRGHRSSLLMNSVERSAPVTEDSEFHYDTRARIAATAEILPCTHWDANACSYCSSAQMCRNLLSVIEDASPVISSAWFSLVLLITAESKHASSCFSNTYIYKCLFPHSTVFAAKINYLSKIHLNLNDREIINITKIFSLIVSVIMNHMLCWNKLLNIKNYHDTWSSISVITICNNNFCYYSHRKH